MIPAVERNQTHSVRFAEQKDIESEEHTVHGTDIEESAQKSLGRCTLMKCAVGFCVVSTFINGVVGLIYATEIDSSEGKSDRTIIAAASLTASVVTCCACAVLNKCGQNRNNQ